MAVDFREWLVIHEGRQEERAAQIQKLWKDTFRALGLEGLSDEDAVQQSLSRLRFNSRSGGGEQTNFSGKQAVLKRLESGGVVAAFDALGDPELKGNSEAVRRWLGVRGDSSASTTVGVLLRRLFGEDLYGRLLSGDTPVPDATPETPQPPSVPPAAPEPDPHAPGSVPQAAAQQPAAPAGAESGLY